MLFKIHVLDSSGTELRRFVEMPVWRECGFELSGHSFDVDRAVEIAAAQKCELVLCVDRPQSAVAVPFLTKAAKKCPDTVVLVISHVESSKNIRECFLLGAVDCLVEPLEPDDLKDALMRASQVVSGRITGKEYQNAVSCAMSAITVSDENRTMLDKLTDFLNKTQGKAASVEEAADFFGFNPDYFRRYFKRRAGISFSDFYKRLTMDYAKLLLMSGHYKVNEVSDLLGYSSADYFTRVFKKVTGYVPSDYRRHTVEGTSEI